MEVLLRAERYGADRPSDSGQSSPLSSFDAVSLTYSMDGFTVMGGSLGTLGIRDDFFKSDELKSAHAEKFSVILHANHKPLIITSSRTSHWDEAPEATLEIMTAADSAGSRSLCMRHFAWLPGKFPQAAFSHCLQVARGRRAWKHLQTVEIDVDSRHLQTARDVYAAVLKQASVEEILVAQAEDGGLK